MSQLEMHAERFVAVLKNCPGEWLSRREIGQRLGQRNVYASQTMALEWLVLEGRIEFRHVPAKNAHTQIVRAEYRFVDAGQQS